MVAFAEGKKYLIKSTMIQGVYDCPKNRIYSEDCPDIVLSNVGLLVDLVEWSQSLARRLSK